jgi:hypothetical protein
VSSYSSLDLDSTVDWEDEATVHGLQVSRKVIPWGIIQDLIYVTYSNVYRVRSSKYEEESVPLHEMYKNSQVGN